MDNYINLKIEDGTDMGAYIAIPAGAAGRTSPGLLLLQEAYGVNHHIRDVAGRFAAKGYVVVVPELFHRTAPPYFEGSYDNFDGVMPHLQAMSVETLSADLKAAHYWLRHFELVNPANIFSIGYCMGGRASFLANAVLTLNAGVSYYGGGTASLADMAPKLSGSHLFFWGGQDKHIGQDQVDTVTRAMDEAGKDYISVKFSNAGHAFANDERPGYNANATKEAWALTLAFFENNMK